MRKVNWGDHYLGIEKEEWEQLEPKDRASAKPQLPGARTFYYKLIKPLPERSQEDPIEIAVCFFLQGETFGCKFIDYGEENERHPKSPR